jgi:hypothetical protein
MPLTFMPQARVRRPGQRGPALVAMGLAVLTVAAWWPAAPVTTAMALVALGATYATLAQYRTFRTILALHAIVYGMLYAMFFGAACHAMATHTGADPWRLVDLAVSAWPMTLTMRLSVRAFCGQRSSSGRSSTGR